MFLKLLVIVTLSIAPLLAVAPVEARRGEQSNAREDAEAGKVKKLREIEGSVIPQMRGMQYLGPEYDPGAQVYRLKFLSGDRVIFVDVDARTGAILRQR